MAETNRGQSSVEYMMTYGIGLLVVLVIGLAAWQSGFFDQTKDVTPDSRGFTQVVPGDWLMDMYGNLNVSIRNDAGEEVKIDARNTTAWVLSGGFGECGAAVVPAALAQNMRAGDVGVIRFTGCPLEGAQVGGYYQVNLTVGYDNPYSGLPHKSVGVIWGPIT